MRLAIFILFTLALLGCERPASTEAQKPSVVATTTMLTDMTRAIAGEDVAVFGIMKPGGDPHLYQPTPGDAKELARAGLVVTSGLHLEGWIDDLVRNANEDVKVVVASKGVDAIRDPDSPGHVDPHFWFDLKAWAVASRNVEAGLSALVPDRKAEFQARGEAYRTQIEDLDQWTRKEIERIPESKRVLITSHDAFRYFGRRYGVEVVGIQGISTESEASQRDVAAVIDLVKARNAPAVFVESSVNPALIEQVARETGARAAGPLYSDSIGPKGGPAETFLGTVKENVRIIVENLSDESATR